MIHSQSRREPGSPAEPPAARVSDAVVSVPRQATGDHPDAYDLYAQIYALRADLSTDASG